MERILKWRILKWREDNEHYEADAVILWCFDSRFDFLGDMGIFGWGGTHSLLKKFIDSRGFMDLDVIKVAGGAKGLAEDGSHGFHYLLDQIYKSIKLHKSPRVILMAHSDCGAYGKKFAAHEEEERFFESELLKAKKAVEDFLASQGMRAEVEAVFADFDGLLKV